MINVISKPTIELKELEIDYKEKVEETDGLEYGISQIGNYPYIYFNDVNIQPSDINYVKIYNDKILPYVEMDFFNSSGALIDDKYPLDDSMLSIFIRSTSEYLMPIRMDFKIMKFENIKGKDNSDAIRYKCTASLNIDDLYLKNFESYDETSFNALKKISESIGLGFASNINNTDDKMVWLNNSMFKLDFINDIVKYSYKDDNSFFFNYIDFYYNLNFIEIETQLTEDISDQVQIYEDGKYQMIKEKPEIRTTPLILTNNPDRNSTNLYFSKYSVENNSTEINLMNGYRKICSQYNFTNDKYDDFLIDPISDEGDDGNIIMKGQPNDSNGFWKNHINREWYGKIDEDNMHKNYYYANTLNNINLNFLQKLKITIKLKKPNYNLYRFQKVLIEIYNFGKPETSTDDKNNKTVEEIKDDQYDNKIINKLSGEWLILGIRFNFSKQDGVYQEIVLSKRELTDKYIFKRKQ